MSLCKKISSTLFVAAILISVSPATVSAKIVENRCQGTTGRELARCTYVNGQSPRLKTASTLQETVRRNTLRDLRILSRKTKATEATTGSTGHVRTYDVNSGNARRIINMRNQEARNACSNLTGTEKYKCVRKNTNRSSRGTVR